MKNPFKFRIDKNSVTIKLDQDICDNNWKTYFGIIQHKCKSLTTENKVLIIDFTSCTFVDPTPMLSICILAGDEMIAGRTVIVKFEKLETESINKKSFLKFVAREGFLKILLITLNEISTRRALTTNITCYAGNKLINESHIETMSNLKNRLNYERSYCLPATIIDLDIVDDGTIGSQTHERSLDEIDKLVDKYLATSISRVVESEVPIGYQAGLLYKLKIVCRESLHNILEHAYTFDGKQSHQNNRHIGLAGIYARYRLGTIGASDDESKYVNSGTLREGQDDKCKVPKLDNSFIKENTGFIELFFADSGKGIKSSLQNFTERSLNSLMTSVFYHGSSRKKIRPTKFGGLHLISQLANTVNNSYVRVCDDATWWGTYLPILDAGDGNLNAIERTSKTDDSFDKSSALVGCYFTYRFSWSNTEAIEIHNKFRRILRNDFSDSKFSEIYSRQSIDRSSTSPCYIEDERFRFDLNEIKNNKDARREYGLYLPSASLMKNKIQSSIRMFLKRANTKTVFIGEIGVIESPAYISAIEKTDLFEVEAEVITREIYLITNSAQFIKFKLIDNRFEQVNNSLDNNYLNKIGYYLYILRHWDSQIIWRNIKSDEISSPRIKREKIDWGNNRIINGYIDFQYAFSNQVNSKILVKSLSRYKNFIGQELAEVEPIDALVKIYTEETNRIYISTKRKDRKLFLGSIQVTGESTSQVISELENEVVYCYVHPNASGVWQSLFAWDEDLLAATGANSGYKRIGRTPFIAKNGWKYYKLPRRNLLGEFAYLQRSSDFYRSIQDFSKPVAKMGHWCYSTHHDFITINILAMFNSQVDDVGFFSDIDLCSYVAKNIFTLFKIDKSKLTKEGVQIFDAIEKNESKYVRHILSSEDNQIPILVYPSHTVTEYIVNFILNLVDDRVIYMELKSRFFALIPTKKNKNVSTFQISGLMNERLLDISSSALSRKDKIISAVIFDDASISSKTLLEIKSLLEGLNITSIYSMILFERRRYPFAAHGFNEKSTVYSRFDMPTLGTSSSCLLCSALRISEELPQMYLSSDIKERLGQWGVEWRERNSIAEWGGNGLRAIPIELSNPDKRYGVGHFVNTESEEVELEPETIKITNSLGLISWITELQTITGRDDIALLIINQENFSPEVRIQIIASQFLYFSSELDTLMLSNLAYELLITLERINTSNIHTSLAALVLLYQNNDVIFRALKRWIDGQKRFNFFAHNIDLQIILSHAYSLGFRLDRREIFNLVKLVSQPQAKYDYLWRFHYEVTDVRGNMHTSPLHKILNMPNRIFDISKQLDLTLSFLKDVFNIDVLTPMIFDLQVYRTYVRASIALIDEVELIVHKIQVGSSGVADHLSKLRILVGKLLANLAFIHNLIFKSILDKPYSTAAGLQNFKDFISTQIENHKRSILSSLSESVRGNNNNCFLDKIKINDFSEADKRQFRSWAVENDFNNVFVFIDYNIMMAISDILGNVRYCDGVEIYNPMFREIQKGDRAPSWITPEFDLEKQKINLVIENGFTGNATELKLKPKKKLEAVLKKLNASAAEGRISVRDDNRFQVILSLSFAHTLESL